MRSLLAPLMLLLIAGCAGDDSDASAAAPYGVTARFEPGGLADVIVVSAVDWRPMRRAELVDPDGERVPAYSLDVVASPWSAGSPGVESLMSTPGAVRVVTQAKVMRSTALIRLPNPMLYARSWRDSHIEVVLGDPDAGEETLTLPAPPPP